MVRLGKNCLRYHGPSAPDPPTFPLHYSPGIPVELNKNYGHFDLGVYLRVIKGGVVKQEDKIEVKI